jgi:hypothetical protein
MRELREIHRRMSKSSLDYLWGQQQLRDQQEREAARGGGWRALVLLFCLLAIPASIAVFFISVWAAL